MKHIVLFVLVVPLAVFISACKVDEDPAAPSAELTASDLMKTGTSWIYDVTVYDSTGAVRYSGDAYRDTVRIIGDTLVNGERWSVTSRVRSGDIDAVYGVGVKNGVYWNYMSGTCPRFTKAVNTPNFKIGLAKNESFDHIYCLMASDGAEIVYKRTLINSTVNVTTATGTLPCMEFRETKYAPDNLSGYSELTLFYHPVYGLVKKEVYGLTKGGTLFRSKVSVLQSLTRGS